MQNLAFEPNYFSANPHFQQDYLVCTYLIENAELHAEP